MNPKIAILHQARRGLAKAAALHRIYGFRETAGMMEKNLLWAEIMYRLEKELALPENLVEAKIPLGLEVFSGIEMFGAIKAEFLKSIREIRGPYGVAQCQYRLERGDVLFTAGTENLTSGFVWLHFSPGVEAGYPLKPDEAYTFDGFTFPRFRGKRVLPVIQQAIFGYLRKKHRHVRRVVTHVAPGNAPSLRGDTRAGYKIKSRELSLIFFGYHRKLRLGTLVGHGK